MHDAESVANDASPVLICDLDGTILQRNSFPLWIMHLMFGRLPEIRLAPRMLLSLRVQQLLLRRRLGRMEHVRLMRGVQLAWHSASPGAAAGATDRLMSQLLRQVRPAFAPVLQRIAAGQVDAVLATAAAAEYAVPLGLQLGFRHVLATTARLPPDGVLNRRTEKLRRVQEFLAARQWEKRSRVLLTDHIDDLPLLQHCQAVGWFGSSAMLDRALAEAKGASFVDCRRLDATALPRAIEAMSAQAVASSAGAPALADSTLR
jgi:phosphoserine phosphatase